MAAAHEEVLLIQPKLWCSTAARKAHPTREDRARTLNDDSEVDEDLLKRHDLRSAAARVFTTFTSMRTL
jgi:hypothetical protein